MTAALRLALLLAQTYGSSPQQAALIKSPEPRSIADAVADALRPDDDPGNWCRTPSLIFFTLNLDPQKPQN